MKSRMENPTTVVHKLVVIGNATNDFHHKGGYSATENIAPETEKTTFGCTLLSQPMKSISTLFSSMSTSKMQDVIFKHVHGIVDLWDGSLPFTVLKWDKGMGRVDEIFHKRLTNIDIAKCIDGQCQPNK